MGGFLNYYPFHLGDYAAHTAHLEPMEDLAYRRMLDLYYRTEKALPESVEDIARLIRMRDFAASIRDVLNEFFTRSDGGWKHARCDAEIVRMQDKQTKAKASAQASVNARSANAQRTLSERSTDVELPTPTPTPKKRTSSASAGVAGFEVFWTAYPRKTAKVAALKAFAKIGPSSDLLDEMVAAVREQSGWAAWQKDGGQFVPHAATWLNARRWEDEKPAPVAAVSSNSLALKRETDAFMAEQRERDKLLSDPTEQARIAEVMARRAVKVTT